MSVKAAISLAAGPLAALLLGVMSAAAPAQTGYDAVDCFDEGLGTVQKTLAGDCNDRLITDDEAAAIRQQRRDYVRKVLSKAPGPDVQGKQLAGRGSGFFVAADGTVVTSHHIIADCSAVSITPTFGEMKLATTVVSEEKSDLALLRADIVPPGIATLVTSDVPAFLGSTFIIGYPNLGLVTIEPILTAVEVIGRASNTPRGPAFIVRGDVRRGNSGGPLLDSGGNVIGIVFAKVNSVNVYKTTGVAVRDIGLALPAEALESFLGSHGVGYREGQYRGPQPEERVLEDARPFLAQIGCWK